jgi:hypothetical protein
MEGANSGDTVRLVGHPIERTRVHANKTLDFFSRAIGPKDITDPSEDYRGV